MDDLSILLKATLDVNKSVDNINKQILQVQDKLKNVNISLNIDDFKGELEKVFGTLESSVKKTKEQKLEFQGLSETTKQIKELSGSLENIYKDLKKVGDVKSLKNVYDTDGNITGFNVQLEKTMGNLKEISNYNVFGQYNKETQEYEYALTKVNSTLKEIDNSSKKINETNKKSTQMTNAKNLDAYYNNARKYVLEVQKGAMDATEALQKLETVMFKSDKSGFTWQFDGLSTQQQKAILADRTKLENEILASKKAQYSVEKQIEQSADKQNANLIKQNSTISDMNSKLNSIKGKYGSSVSSSDFARVQQMVDALKQLDPATKTYSARVAECQKAIANLNRESADGFKKTQDTISDTTSKTSELGLAIRTVGQMFAIGSPIYLAQQVFRDMATSVNELNKSLTDIRIVTGMGVGDVVELRNSYNDLGKSIGAVTNDLLQASTEWFRQGKTVSEAQDLVMSSIVGSKLSGVDSAQMTEFLTSALNGYKKSASEAINIVDKLVGVDNAAATSVEELAIAMSQTSSSAQMAGVDLDTLIGYIGTVSSVTRKSAESIGNSFKTIFARYQDIKIGGKNGFLEDGIGVSEIEKVFDSIGIKIKENENTFRDFGDVVDDLSKKWKYLSDVEQSAVAKTLAGVRQRENFIVLMDNISMATDLAATSADSAGLAMDRFNIYMEGTEAALNRFKATAESVFMNTLNSSSVNNIINMGTAMLEFVSATGGLVPILTSIVSLMIILKADLVGNMIMGTTKSITSLGGAFSFIKFSIIDANTALKAYNAGIITTTTLMQTMLPVVGMITIAISGIAMAINAYNQHQEEMIKLAYEGKLKKEEELKTTQQLLDKYKSLSEQDKNSKEVREQLLEVQKQLADIHGVETRELDLLTKSYEENIAVIEKAIEQKQRLLDVDNDIVSKDLEDKLNNALKINVIGNKDEIKNGLKDVMKEMTDSFDVFSRNGEFKIRLNPELSEQQSLNALSELLDKLEFAGMKNTNVYSMVAKSYSELANAITDVNTQLEKENALEIEKNNNAVRSTVAVDAQKRGIQDLSKASLDQVKALESVYVSQQVLSKGQAYATQAQQEFKQAMIGVNSEYDTFVNGVSESTEETEEFASSMDELNKAIDNVADGVDLIDGSIRKLNEGTGLTTDEIRKLIEKFPQLSSELVKTESGYTINKEALEKLRESTINYERQTLQSQINSTKSVLTQSSKRLEAYGIELSAINSLASAQVEANKVLDAKASSMFGNYRPVGYDKQYNAEEQAIVDRIKLIGELEEKKKQLDLIDVGGTNKQVKTKKEKKSDNPFQKEIDGIKQAREEIEREIAIIQSKLDLSEMQGDSKAFDEYSDKMTLLLAKQKELADVEVSKFNALKGKYKKEEEQLTLNEAIAESTRAKYADEKEYLEQTISLIQRKTDLEERAYDDKLRQIELSQMLMDENSNEYMQSEELKMTMLLEKQSQYQEKILALKKTGLSDESTLVREYIKMHNDAEVERLNIFKALAEKRRQIEIENLNTQKDQLQKQYDAKKSLLDMTIEMLKEEGKAKQQAVKDELSNMKKIADEKKRLLKKEQDQRKFDREVDSANEEIKALQGELNKIMFDNSDWAKAERARLTKQLEDKQKALEDKYSDDKLEKEMDAIDEQVKLFEDKKNKELEIIEKTELSEVELKKKALDMIDKQNKALYNKLKKYNSETLKMSQAEFDKMWETANKGLENFGINSKSTLEIMYDMADAMERLAKQAEILGKTPLSYDTTVNAPNGGKPTGEEWYKKKDENAKKMKSNSEKWFSATPEEKDRLSKENTQLAQTIGAWKGADGEWYIMINGKRMKLYDSIGVRHNGILGGFAGNGMLPNEVLIKATTDEIVLNKSQQDVLTKNIVGLKNRQSQIPSIQLNFNGTVTEGAKPLLRDFKREIEDMMYKIVNESI